jgi:hypothetical protein
VEELKQLPIDDKLNFIIDQVSNINFLKYRIDSLESTVFLHGAHNEVTDERIRLLEYKQIDLEARTRASNLIISGIDEIQNENCIDHANSVIEKMNLDPDSFVIVRAQRLGRVATPRASFLGPKPTSKPRPRQILVTFAQPVEVDFLISSAKNLKGTDIGISRDFPREITDARKALWPFFKEARTNYGPKNVKMLYPAALQVNGRITRDMFPDWFIILRGSRNSYIPKRVSEKVQIQRERILKVISNAQNSTSTFQPPDRLNTMEPQVATYDDQAPDAPSSPRSVTTDASDISASSSTSTSCQSRGKGPLGGKTSKLSVPLVQRLSSTPSNSKPSSRSSSRTRVSRAMTESTPLSERQPAQKDPGISTESESRKEPLPSEGSG